MDERSKAIEDFKIGFLAKAASLGLRPDDLFVLAFDRLLKARPELEKKAQSSVPGEVVEIGGRLGSSAIEAGGQIASTTVDNLLSLLIPLGIFAPILLGAGGGLLASKAGSPSKLDVDTLRQREKLLAYKKALQRIKNKDKSRKLTAVAGELRRGVR